MNSFGSLDPVLGGPVMGINETRMIRWGSTLASLVSVAGVVQLSLPGMDAGQNPIDLNPLLLIFFWLIAVSLVVVSAVAWSGGSQRILAAIGRLVAGLRGWGGWLWPLMLALVCVFPVVVMSDTELDFGLFFTRQMLFLWLWMLLSLVVVAYWQKPWPGMVAAAGLSMAVVYQLVTYFPHVSDTPFALWWSETTRFYLASTFFDQRIYGQDLPWVFRDFTRYMMQAVPFLVPGTPIWLHRLWQVALRFTSGYLTGTLLARRLKLTGLPFGLFTAWAGLYFFQGPVFYNLIVIVMLVVWLVDVNRFWKTFLVVVIASVYAGLSRINWIPMAGLMAALYYFMEVRVEGRDARAVLRYLVPPIVWVAVGLGVGFGVQQFWAANSGNPPEVFYSSFTSYLLWERLLPNPSFPIGVLPYTLLITAPLLVYLFLNLRGWRERWHPIRLLGVAGIISVLFIGGLVVSIKIGGGTNLHNMDVYLVALLIVATDLYYGRVVDEHGQRLQSVMPAWLKAAVFVVPVIFAASFGGRPIPDIDDQTVLRDLETIQSYAEQAVADGGEVLFIAERQLLTFGYIEGVPLVHEHEKLLLQEMAMSKNEVYLDAFGEEMAAQKYALIISNVMPMNWKNPDKMALAMENNVAFREITPRINCAYDVEEVLVYSNLELWTPSEEVTCLATRSEH